MADAPFADEIARAPVEPADAGPGRALHRAGRPGAALVGSGSGGADAAARGGRRGGRSKRCGAPALRRRAHRRQPVRARSRLSRRSAFPNPEEPGATDALLALAADVDAEIAIALDPDADRCAVGIPTPAGWRMLSGDETGWLLGDYILSRTEPSKRAASVVASTVVSSRMLAAIAAHWGARHVETLTGFKWLARADADLPGSTLVYAYEEAIGHCVDPAAVRDKDGISAAVLVCDLVATLKHAAPFGARRARRPRPPVRGARRRGGVAAGGRRRRGGRADAPAAGVAAQPPGRIRFDHNGSTAARGRIAPMR